MPFITPALFWAGAAAASGPIIIHLLNRRRFRILDWAAMDFLLQSQRKNRRRVKIEELILLLLRILAILLMGMALARPLLSKANLIPFTETGKDIVVVLDDSFSMAQKQGAETIFSKAQEGLLQLAGQVGSKDTFAVYLTSRADPFFPPGYLPQAGLDAFKNEVKGLVCSDYPTQLDVAVQRAVKVFEESKNPEKRFYILSDFRRREWNLDANGSQGKNVFNRLKALNNKGIKAILVDFGSAESANLAIAELSCSGKHIVKNIPLQFRVTVVNHGAQAVADVPVNLQIGDVKLPLRKLDRIDPGQQKSVEFSYRFRDAGPAVVTATIPGDQLAPDNAAYLAFNVVEPVPVLVVNGNPDRERFVNEPDFFVGAIDPGHFDETRDRKNLSSFRPEVISENDVLSKKLSDYDCIVLANVSRLFPDSLKALDAYVKDGGGLVIFLGNKTDREFYNGTFYNEGRGLLPLALDPPRINEKFGKKFAKLKLDAKNHPVLSVFEGTGEALIEIVPFYSYYPLRANRAATGVNILASFVDKADPNPAPAIAEKTHGRGRVIEIGTSANAAWHDWPQTPSYLIVMNEMVAYLGRAQRLENTQPVGAAIKRELEPEFTAASIELKTPRFPEQAPIKIAPTQVKDKDGETERMFILWPPPLAGSEPDQPRRAARVERNVVGLDSAGIYTLELTASNKTRKELYARNVDADEGRLEKTDAGVVDQIMREMPYEYRRAVLASEASKSAGGSELWRWVLFALLGLLVIETILAQRFGHYSA